MNTILLEELSRAIGARQFVQFKYAEQEYQIEPHLLGQNKNRQDCLCGWSAENKDNPNAKTGWHCFLLQDIKELKIMEKRFYKTRPGYDPYDSAMSRIYYRA
ncbi:hypothetical protein [Pontibacter fetidus]|uniref:WYL domain-containing protein n=1 Tax=Pontibacter fetidus TaxID=2700082 RepID=A0A6B2H300_9BACT|nr:hypothetical protein [Pontibacter fetidus]NDK56771.1 hypothetical protein [Pontibacter fetidus]